MQVGKEEWQDWLANLFTIGSRVIHAWRPGQSNMDIGMLALESRWLRM